MWPQATASEQYPALLTLPITQFVFGGSCQTHSSSLGGGSSM